MTMSDQTKINTLGPADPKAPSRAKRYAVVAALLGLLPALVAFNVLTQEQATSLLEAYGAGVGLLGAFGLGFASLKTRKQVENGTFTEVDIPPDPVGSVFEQLAILKGEVDRTVSDATGKVVDAAAVIQGVVSAIPGGAAISQAVTSGPAGDLLQWLSDHPETPDN
jgi:hypothetical protein